MTIVEFEQMALEAVRSSKIKDFDKLICHFTKWSSEDESTCYVCIYPNKGPGQSGDSKHPSDAIKLAVMKLERQQNPEEVVLTNE